MLRLRSISQAAEPALGIVVKISYAHLGPTTSDAERSRTAPCTVRAALGACSTSTVHRLQVTQDVPLLPRYTVSVEVNPAVCGSTADTADAADARFEAIAATFGPYLRFGEACLSAAAGGDTVSDGEGGGGSGAQRSAANDDRDCSFAAPLVLADPADGCGGALANANAVRGAIVGVRRGGCTFATKVVC